MARDRLSAPTVEAEPAPAANLEHIEAQHRALLERVDALGQGLEAGALAELGPLLGFLHEHVVEHFSYEERQMKRTGYPDFAAHRAAHDRFVREVAQHQLHFETEGARPWLARQVHQWLQRWLAEHIAEMDADLARFLASARPEKDP